MSKLIAFRASEELREAIDKAAGEQDRSVSWIITNALEQVLKPETGKTSSDVGQGDVAQAAERRSSVMPKGRIGTAKVGGSSPPVSTKSLYGLNEGLDTEDMGTTSGEYLGLKRDTTASGSQSKKISSAVPEEVTYEKDDYSQ